MLQKCQNNLNIHRIIKFLKEIEYKSKLSLLILVINNLKFKEKVFLFFQKNKNNFFSFFFFNLEKNSEALN